MSNRHFVASLRLLIDNTANLSLIQSIVRAHSEEPSTSYDDWRDVGDLLVEKYHGTPHEQMFRKAWCARGVKERTDHVWDLTVKQRQETQARAEADGALAARVSQAISSPGTKTSASGKDHSTDAVYRERNLLAIALARLALHKGWEAGYTRKDGEQAVVYVNLPGNQQVSWHMDYELTNLMARWLPQYPREWDGQFLARNPRWPAAIPCADLKQGRELVEFDTTDAGQVLDKLTQTLSETELAQPLSLESAAKRLDGVLAELKEVRSGLDSVKQRLSKVEQAQGEPNPALQSILDALNKKTQVVIDPESFKVKLSVSPYRVGDEHPTFVCSGFGLGLDAGPAGVSSPGTKAVVDTIVAALTNAKELGATHYSGTLDREHFLYKQEDGIWLVYAESDLDRGKFEWMPSWNTADFFQTKLNAIPL